MPEKDVMCLSNALEDISDACSALHKKDEHGQTRWALIWVVPSPLEREDLERRLNITAESYGVAMPEIVGFTCEELPDVNWLEESYRRFPPFTLGPFYIYGSHSNDPVPAGFTGLQIDAATAFGSGEHPTTSGCLQAMAALKDQGVCPWNVLDMGCGSGILSVAAWKLWKTPVLGVDIEDEAVIVTRRHAEMNKVPDDSTGLTARQSEGMQAGIIARKKPFDLIIANILAGPLIEMAPDLCDACDDNGYVILSGILDEQRDLVLSAYEADGLSLRDTQSIDGWSTLVLQKAS